ncbi:MAG: hypothetical protein AAF604_23985 [Acidobacteriota bacterium]
MLSTEIVGASDSSASFEGNGPRGIPSYNGSSEITVEARDDRRLEVGVGSVADQVEALETAQRRQEHAIAACSLHPLLFNERSFTEDSLHSLPRFEPAPRSIRPEIPAPTELILLTALAAAGPRRGQGTWSME